MDSAKKILEDSKSSATGCYLSVLKLHDTDWLTWEPESIWLTLKEQGIQITESNRAMLLAVRSLHSTELFWMDAMVFEKTCVALNHEPLLFDAIEDCPVSYCAWALREIDHLSKVIPEISKMELQREPIGYLGVQLFREGFVISPEELRMAQSSLDKYLPSEVKEVQKKVAEGWAAAPKNGLFNAAYPETTLGVQLARLAHVHQHVQECEARYLKDIAMLRDPYQG